MKSYLRSTLVLFLISLVIQNCSTESDPAILDNRPVTKGIFVTGNSPDAIATWGSPDIPTSPKSNTVGYEMRNVYPNPADGAMSIELRVPKNITGRVWMERARWENEGKIEIEIPIQIEITDQEFEEGDHLIRLNNGFNCGNSEDRNLEEGFYRVYFETVDFYYWKDIYITGYRENTPEGLEQYTNEFCQ